MISPNVVSSLDGVSNDAGNIDLVAGANISITPDDGNNNITIAASAADDGDWATSGDDIYRNTGNVGIGTDSPGYRLHISRQEDSQICVENPGPAYDKNVGYRIRSHTAAMFPEADWYIYSNWSADLVISDQEAGTNPLFIQAESPTNSLVIRTGGVGIGTSSPGRELDVAGTTRTEVLEITGGSDLAEPFRLSSAGDVKPGWVVSIDPLHPGELQVARTAYDRRVAGVVSGGRGLNPGLVMSQHGSEADGSHPIALSGRVYCWCDAGYGPIAPGDLLTTSGTVGHAMKVTDHDRASGAILGKAMSSLEDGRGLVLVLVSLQ
jgi:hypothetical protein